MYLRCGFAGLFYILFVIIQFFIVLVLLFWGLDFIVSFCVGVEKIVAYFADVSDCVDVGGFVSAEVSDFYFKDLRLGFYWQAPMFMEIAYFIESHFQLR